MSKPLHDWEKHVQRRDHLAWCGERLETFEWYFTNAEHAILSTGSTRLQPCPACLAAMIAVLEAAQ